MLTIYKHSEGLPKIYIIFDIKLIVANIDSIIVQMLQQDRFNLCLNWTIIIIYKIVVGNDIIDKISKTS